VLNCTFSENSTVNNGGGMYNNSSDPTVWNCIFWNNSDAGGMDESGQIHTQAGTPVVNYSDVQGGWTGAGGTGNLNTDPFFADADGADDTVGTPDDDLRLSPGSPGIDVGSNVAIPAGITTDLDGGDRIINSTVDMGAYDGISWYITSRRPPIISPFSQRLMPQSTGTLSRPTRRPTTRGSIFSARQSRFDRPAAIQPTPSSAAMLTGSLRTMPVAG